MRDIPPLNLKPVRDGKKLAKSMARLTSRFIHGRLNLKEMRALTELACPRQDRALRHCFSYFVRTAHAITAAVAAEEEEEEEEEKAEFSEPFGGSVFLPLPVRMKDTLIRLGAQIIADVWKLIEEETSSRHHDDGGIVPSKLYETPTEFP